MEEEEVWGEKWPAMQSFSLSAHLSSTLHTVGGNVCDMHVT